MPTYTPKLVMLTEFININLKYISKNRLRFIFLLIKRFSGGVVGEPGFPTKVRKILTVIIYNAP
jgi:hypothetical protein